MNLHLKISNGEDNKAYRYLQYLCKLAIVIKLSLDFHFEMVLNGSKQLKSYKQVELYIYAIIFVFIYYLINDRIK